ncbi:hypothetical protein HDU67_005896, partial [Dinochytrium kinnereticum]
MARSPPLKPDAASPTVVKKNATSNGGGKRVAKSVSSRSGSGSRSRSRSYSRSVSSGSRS